LSSLDFDLKYINELNEFEKDFLIESYYKLFIKMYGNDIVDTFSYIVKRSTKELIDKKSDLKLFAKNYKNAIELLKPKNNPNNKLLVIYLNKKIVGSAYLKRINDDICSIPFVSINVEDKEIEREIWKDSVSFSIQYLKKSGYKKMYLEIPLKEGPLLVRASELGFKEDPNDILVDEETYTYILSLDLETNDMPNKILVINKDKGYTSRDVVNKLVKILGTKRIGHTGTLDPMATGVLVCLTGKYTKLVDMITSYQKEYIATIKLGIKTDTLDITGNIIEENYNYRINKKDVIEALNGFLGESVQTVPIYSAIHVDGKRLYEYARENKQVELPKKNIFIKEIELLSYQEDLIKFRVIVSKGTYIRSLINDICDTLNVLGTMSELIRTKQGNLEINDSYTLEDISCGNYEALKLEDVLNIQIVNLDKFLEKKVINGNKLELDYDGYILFKKCGIDIALYYFENKIGKLKILF